MSSLLNDAERELVVRMLRARPASDEVAVGLLARLKSDVAKDAEHTARLRAEGEAAAAALLPKLEEALAEGSYVRSAYHAPSQLGPWVAVSQPQPDRFYWHGALLALARAGTRTQMVYWESPRGGMSVQGYRLAPPGDERSSVSLGDVYGPAGRCRLCGVPRGATTRCPRAGGTGVYGHEFDEAAVPS